MTQFYDITIERNFSFVKKEKISIEIFGDEGDAAYVSDDELVPSDGNTISFRIMGAQIIKLWAR